MAETRNAKLECADNGGYILCYDEVTKGSGTYSSMDYKQKEEIFSEDQGEEALERLNELSGHKPAVKMDSPAQEHKEKEY